MSAESSTPSRKPLWVRPIPIVGLSGEVASGKTFFGLTICPGPSTLCYDEEKSSASYDYLNHERIDLFDEVRRKHPNGFLPVDVFNWWLAHVRSIEPGKYRVIMLDTIGTVEAGLVDWVETHPHHFGKTPQQYEKMAALMWGDVKEYWKLILSDLASRCETFVFTSHMGDIFKDNKPSGKRKPKGKDTLRELASLYLLMELTPDAKGDLPEKPSATVIKSRLMTPTWNAAAEEWDSVRSLPRRLPVATPKMVRQYMTNPAGGRTANPAELAPEEKMSEDERLRLQAEIAAAQRDTEVARLAREQGSTATLTANAASVNEMKAIAADLNAPEAKVIEFLQSKYNVGRYEDLTQRQADELLENMRKQREKMKVSQPRQVTTDDGNVQQPAAVGGNGSVVSSSN